MIRVLVATLDELLARELAAELGRQNAESECVAPQRVVAGLENGSYDALLVDLDGESERWRLLRVVRSQPAWTSVAVAALTSRRDPSSRVADAFRSGLDDYVVRPLEPVVLVARLHALVRLRRRLEPKARSLKTRDGRLMLERATRKCWTADRAKKVELELTRKEFDLLAYLLLKRNQLVPREELLQSLWQGVALEDNSRTLVQHVLHLRAKLGALGDRLETVRGLGYRFADP